MHGAEPPLSPTVEDEPLSSDPANWPSHLTVGLSWFAEGQVRFHLALFSVEMRVMGDVATTNIL